MAVKALFLDRDGVVNEDTGYVFEEEKFRFIDGIFELCRAALNKGYLIIIVTNQSGIERGYFSEDDFRSLTGWMLERFQLAGVHITDVLFCPSLSGPDRKPNPGMFLTAKSRYGIDMSASVSLGDKERDVQAGRTAGVGTNILLSASGARRQENTSLQSDADRIIATHKEMENLL